MIAGLALAALVAPGAHAQERKPAPETVPRNRSRPRFRQRNRGLERVLRERVLRRGIPVIYENSSIVDAGGLMSYGPDFRQLARRTAAYVDRILKGAKPGDLPIERLERIEFVINLKTAAALGLTIPPALVALADRVIE